jgi:hypothetical protein
VKIPLSESHFFLTISRRKSFYFRSDQMESLAAEYRDRTKSLSEILDEICDVDGQLLHSLARIVRDDCQKYGIDYH